MYCWLPILKAIAILYITNNWYAASFIVYWISDVRYSNIKESIIIGDSKMIRQRFILYLACWENLEKKLEMFPLSIRFQDTWCFIQLVKNLISLNYRTINQSFMKFGTIHDYFVVNYLTNSRNKYPRPNRKISSMKICGKHPLDETWTGAIIHLIFWIH